MGAWSRVNFSRLYSSLRLDAEFYEPRYLESESEVLRHPTRRLVDLALKIDVGHVGSMVSRYREEGVLLLQTRNVRPFFLDTDDCVNIDGQFHELLRKSHVHRGDILIARSGSFGCAGMYFGERTINSADIIIIQPKSNKVNPLYLLAFINSWYGQFQIRRFASGGLQGHVNLTILESLRIPLPPLATQERVAEVVERARGANDWASATYCKAERLLLEELGFGELDLSPTLFYNRGFSETQQVARLDAEFFEAKYYALIEAIRKTGKGRLLGGIVAHCERGLQPEYDAEGEVAVVNTKHMGRQFLSDDFERCSLAAWMKQKKARLKPYDVLFYSTGAYIGRANCWFGDEKAIGSNHVTIIRPSAECNPVYLSLFMNSRVGVMQAERLAHGSAQREVYPSDLRAYTVWLPSMKKQEEMGQMVMDSKAALDESRRLLGEAKRLVEEMVLSGAQG